MAYNKTEKEVLSLLTPIAEDASVEIWDVTFQKEGPDYVLRVYLDKEGGISIDDCERVSRALDVVLDEKDPIPQAYMLEVSSAGLDRAIKYDFHFEKCMGKNVDVKLFAPINKEREITAKLIGFCDNVVSLDRGGESLEIPMDKISQIRLTVEF